KVDSLLVAGIGLLWPHRVAAASRRANTTGVNIRRILPVGPFCCGNRRSLLLQKTVIHNRSAPAQGLRVWGGLLDDSDLHCMLLSAPAASSASAIIADS